MTKDEINFNINNSIAINGAGMGATSWAILYNMPYLIAHPNVAQILSMAMPGFFLYHFYTRYKEQRNITKQILDKNQIKDYQNPVHLAFTSGLYGSAALTFLLFALDKPTLLHLGLGALSSSFFGPTFENLRDLMSDNKKLIDKIR